MTIQIEQREVWKPVPGHPNYEASSLGNVRSVDHQTTDGRCIKGRVLKPWAAAGGYLYVNLGSEVRRGVNRVVASAFHGEPDDGLEAAHLNGDKTDNRPSNLAWVTHRENESHKDIHGTRAIVRPFGKPWHKKRGPKAARHPMADQITQRRSAGASLSELAAAFGMSKSGMAGVLRNRI